MTTFQQIEMMISDSLNTQKKLLYMIEDIEAVVDQIITVLTRGNKIMVAGNGGSASDADHFVAELVGRFQVDRKPLAAISLTSDASTFTAIANDYGYEDVFARQVRALSQPGDLLFVISTSGKSKNILNALEACFGRQVNSIALTGKNKVLGAKNLNVPSEVTSEIQDAHRVIIHAICGAIEKKMFHL